jgi:hypothetical protein
VVHHVGSSRSWIPGLTYIVLVQVFCHSRESGNPGLVIKKIKYKKNGDEKINYSTGFPLSRE